MKKNIQLKTSAIIISIFGLNFLSAQILNNNGQYALITNSNVLIDGSTNFSTEAGAGANVGKGIIIPSVNLVNFDFDLTLADGSTFPTYFDGMLVYNNATGTTLTTGNRSSTATAVTPGYYYFSNPNGAANGNITGGVWTAMGSGAAGAVKDITTTEIELSTKVDGEQLYAIKGAFTLASASSSVTFTIPTGMTGYYSFVTYKDGKTFRRDINSFTISDTNATVVFGTGIYSEVFEAATYNYVLEYFK